ncbi:DUF2017 family protein [Georgenia sp. 10Sc9-8]|uniref:DUF2017 family protein n=1 Tax=Georgenia halotolerans TaxID=3028317 RepID=A0ABT5TYU6_9MICO|nr:DUF2017 family protein [Georgenia halotolerans]
MEAFAPVPGGVASRLEENERVVLARLFADTAELLGSPLTGTAEDDLPPDLATPASAEDAVLAALDFEPGAGPDAPADPALARLLPPMSADDVELAAELRGLTEQSLRDTKVGHLQQVWRELRVPGGPDGAVVVRGGTERAWLSALTDVRLVLAARLGVEDDADAEAVYARAQLGPLRSGEPARSREEEVTDALATMYAALTWWQESLLEALPFAEGGG